MKQKTCPQNKVLAPIAQQILPHQVKIELATLSAILVGFIIGSRMLAISQTLFVIAFSVLGLMYYLLTFKILPDSTPIRTCFTYRLLGVGQSISAIGLLCTLLSLPVGNMFIVAGGLTLGIASFSLVLARNLNKVDRATSQLDIIRAFIILCFVFGVMYYQHQIVL